MSDDLVKRYTTYNVMMSKESGKYISSPDGKWVLFTDHANRIAELEAKLAKAVEMALEECPYRWGTHAYEDWQIDRRTTLAELKGETQ